MDLKLNLDAPTFSEIQLGPPEWDFINKYSVKKKFKKGEVITGFNTIEKHIYFIFEGVIRIYGVRNDKEISFEFAFKNQFASCIVSYLTQTPSFVQMVALKNTIVRSINYDTYNALLETSLSLNKLARKLFQNSVIRRIHRERILVFHTAEERYELLLKKRPEIFEHIPQYMIASYLNLTPETLSRVIKKKK